MSLIVVPIGTTITISSAELPVWLRPRPISPGSPLITFLYLKSISVRKPLSALKIILPPLPPFPPSGPPSGTYFSRKKEVQPSPPFPAISFKLTSSINIVSSHFL